MIANYMKDLQDEGINLIDIGSSGSLDEKWQPLKDLINLIGFDPNEVECSRQNSLPSKYKNSKFLPYAIHGHNGVETLYMTNSIYCYSLLRPNKSWLDRFSFRELFDLTGEEEIHVHDISEINELKKIRPDVIKIDVQGLELPILSRAVDILESAFYVETETGFTQNYIGETTFSQLDGFMQAQGFLMFDINTNHRVPRDNYFKNYPSGKEQILWAESVWLKDYIELERRGLFDISMFNERKIKKILILCSLQGCYDFGLELAEFFHTKGFLSKKEISCLKSIDAWQFVSHLSDPKHEHIRIDHKNTNNFYFKIYKAIKNIF